MAGATVLLVDDRDTTLEAALQFHGFDVSGLVAAHSPQPPIHLSTQFCSRWTSRTPGVRSARRGRS